MPKQRARQPKHSHHGGGGPKRVPVWNILLKHLKTPLNWNAAAQRIRCDLGLNESSFGDELERNEPSPRKPRTNHSSIVAFREGKDGVLAHEFNEDSGAWTL